MQRVLVVFGAIAAILAFSSCQWSPYNLSPIYLLSDDSIKLVEGYSSKHISLTVSYETIDEHNQVTETILADGPLLDGELKFNQRVLEPTEVKISVTRELAEDNNVGETTALLRPNSPIKFVFISPDMVVLKGSNHRSVDQYRKFSITGNLSGIEGFEPTFLFEPGIVQVTVLAKPSSIDGSGKTLEFGPVLLDEDEFSIEGDLDEPTLVTVKIFESPSLFRKSAEYLPAILEPGVNYRVVPLGNNGKWAVQADREGLHTRFVSSWQLDPEYVSLVDRWMGDGIDSRNELRVRLEHEKEFITNFPVAEECDHVKLSKNIKLEFADPAPNSRPAIGSEIVKWRSAALREILSDTQDLDLVRMVFELSWTQFDEDEIVSEFDYDERVATLLELALKMDQDVFDQFISPQFDRLKANNELDVANRTLIPGQVAPEFTLSTITGEEVSLAEVVKENRLVLVDFWASWCGPCIASFPALKKFYAQNKDRGFEIVTISIDDSFEDWESASDEQNLPWIDLRDADVSEMKSDFASIANEYGVIWIPSKFLVDKTGCIVHKHFSDGDLGKILSSL